MSLYSKEELDQMALRDLMIDAEVSRKQSIYGPFYPERGITSESLMLYAKKCEEKIRKFSDGGLHNHILNGD